MKNWDNYSPRQVPPGQCVYSCKTCGALVASENIPTHDRWHLSKPLPDVRHARFIG